MSPTFVWVGKEANDVIIIGRGVEILQNCYGGPFQNGHIFIPRPKGSGIYNML